MIKILTLTLLVFSSTLLFGQETNWQSYTSINHFSSGSDMGEHILLARGRSIVRLNKGDKKIELINAVDLSGLKLVKKIIPGKDNNLFFLGYKNEIIEKKNGLLTTWPLDPLFELHSLNAIYGQTQSGGLYVQSQLGHLLFYGKNEGARLVNTLPPNIHGRIRGLVFNNKDQAWVWSNNHLVLLNRDESVVFSQEFTEVYIANVKYDDRGYLWVFTNEDVRILSTDTGDWSIIKFEEIGFSYAYRFLLHPDHSALIFTERTVFNLLFDGSAFHVENDSEQFTEENYPYSYSLLDNDGTLWYVNYKDYKLSYWKRGNPPRVIDYRPWLPINDINGIALDKEGKVWLGGSLNLAYILGGKWSQSSVINPFEFHENALISEIEFTPDNQPIISLGQQAFFGPISSVILQKNGSHWDTIQGATIGPSFLQITHLKLDQQQNLWVLRANENVLSIRSRGKWTRLKVSDTPLKANFFTCLTENKNGKMWIGTDKGIVIYDGYHFETIDSTTLSLGNAVIKDIFFDDKKRVWVTTSNEGIRKRDGTQWETLRPDLDLDVHFPLNKIIQGVGTEMWVSLKQNGLLHYDGQEWKYINHENSGLISFTISDMLKDPQNRIWFISGKRTVSILNPDEKGIKPFELDHSHNLAIYPNPGCCLYRLHWNVETISDTQIELLNSAGQLIRNWTYDKQQLGTYELDIKQGNLVPGIYHIRLSKNQKTIKTIPFVIIS